MKKVIILFILSSTVLASSTREECPPLDFSQSGGSMASMERTDQMAASFGPDDHGTCYAHAAGYMLGQLAGRSNLEEFSVNPLFLALLTSIRSFDHEVSSGHIAQVLYVFREQGSCYLAEQDYSFIGAAFRYLRSNDSNERGYLQSTFSQEQRRLIQRADEEDLSTVFYEIIVSELEDQFPNLRENFTEQRFNELLRFESNYLRFTLSILGGLCPRQQSSTLPDFEIDYVHEVSDEERRLFIQSHLDEGRAVAISYEMNFMLRLLRRRPEDYHASVIVGRRWNERRERCEFKIWNTWGESCRGIRGRFDCEDGELWIPEENLLEATYSSTAIVEN